jgi:hypothetical protein
MGSGYRTFTAGEVLTASNVQNYLQDQAVMVFAGTAARSSAIGTANFEEGMLTYLTDVDKLQVYTGAAFADVYPAAASTQGLTLINTTSFSAVASQSINDVFSTTYDNYLLLIQGVGSSASSDLEFRLRVGGVDASGATDYVVPSLYNAQNSSTVANAGGAAQSYGYLGFTSNDRFVTTSTIFNPFLSQQTFNTFHNYGANYQLWGGTRHALTTSYTGLTLSVAGGTMTGIASIYGFNK